MMPDVTFGQTHCAFCQRALNSGGRCVVCEGQARVDHRAQQKAEPAWKQDGGKPRMDLIAPEMLVATANVLAFGAAKYDERNWEKGMSWGRCFGALMRHMWAWWGGEKADPETGYSHLWHASACLMFLIAYEERKTGTDDRKIPVDNA
jgi:hypothetical protein